jgi:hypothetical protein
MDFSDPEVPDWFWLVIDAAGHRLDVLRAWLMNQPKDVVVAYGHAYEVAAADLVEGYSGTRRTPGRSRCPSFHSATRSPRRCAYRAYRQQDLRLSVPGLHGSQVGSTP